MSEQVETAARPQLEYAIARDRDAALGAAMTALLQRLKQGDVVCDVCSGGWAVSVQRTKETIQGLCDRCTRRAAFARSRQSGSR